jgi:ketosteroid isomerase-like protein
MAFKSVTRFAISALVALTATLGASAQEAPSPDQIHGELRALKDRAVDAINKRDKDTFFKDVAPNITFTAMDNDVIHGLDKLRAYYDQTFASPSSFIKAMTLKVEADALSELYADNRIAVASGKADAHFKLVGDREFDWPLRWTATLTRNDGKWSIVSLHFSGNSIDNPLMTAATSFGRWIAVAAGIGGLVLGFLLAWLWRRRVSA